VWQKQDLIAVRTRVEPFTDDDDRPWLAEGICDATDDRPDRVGGDGHDDDLGFVERSPDLGIVERGDARR
jgi:hypothetical protein